MSGDSRTPGSRISVSDYPGQGLDVPTEGYPTPRALRQRGVEKYPVPWSPVSGRSLAELARLDQSGRLSAQGGWDQAADSWHPGDSRGEDY